MTDFIECLEDVAPQYDAIVFDQWGVLHNGTEPYLGAPKAIAALNQAGQPAAVLSNSGKRAQPNEARIKSIGFSKVWFDHVMTSGEALWRDIQSSQVPHSTFFAIERESGDAVAWAEGLQGLVFTPSVNTAEAVLLMGLPDGSSAAPWKQTLETALENKLTVYCSNPDRISPRGGGKTVISPGALAHDYQDAGGTVVFYGKPHAPVFKSLEAALGTSKILMVGDSLEHDIAGAYNVGWDNVLVQNGLYADRFASGDRVQSLSELCASYAVPPPTFSMKELS
ncbi:MAG: TIGR01459 family HAD-type hydrolase [Dinoroseobacter sp.]|nr:TIGR01459 family HAD-type hydrolase [Dinoroseobacter sp.]